VRRVALSVVLMLLLGVVAGLVWLWVADPADWEARSTGIVLTEGAARDQFSVVVAFAMIGAVVSLGWAWISAVVLEDIGWLITPVVVVASVLAGVIAWRVGVELGPPSPAGVTGVEVGDTIPSRLAVDGVAPFLVWPIFGLIGVVVGLTGRGERDGELLDA
jgi:hypothetical protein